MLCYQCEQTAKGSGCTIAGVCGKDAETAALQDLLLTITKGISMYAHRARQFGLVDREIDVFVIEALFSTVTNVNFDPGVIEKLIHDAVGMRSKARNLFERGANDEGTIAADLGGPATFPAGTNRDELLSQASEAGIESRRAQYGDTVAGLQDLILFGLKGAAAYMDHAHILGKDDDSIYASFHEILDFLGSGPDSVDDLVAKAMEVGEINLRVMQILDAANTDTYGHPEPTQVRVEPVKGKAILVSGHDLLDLAELLKQTEGKGINVYTHGEMLPANAYPGLKKYKHLVGNYGSAWQNQTREFAVFPGAILMTTNCIQRPSETYKGRIFTSGLVQYPGVTHISDKNFAPVIKAALEAPGFAEDGPDKTITIGFARQSVMSVADKVIEAVKSGKIRHFFLVGGCDGAKPGRSYYTDFVEKSPKDTVILTLACGKYRFNKMDLGTIDGIPRLLDIGQCNDAYSAIRIAGALADAFGTDVNGLPLTLVLSWYEQKAVAILLTLLYLGIKGIRIGPSLPAFLTPPVLQVLIDNFNLKPIKTAEIDLAEILGT